MSDLPSVDFSSWSGASASDFPPAAAAVVAPSLLRRFGSDGLKDFFEVQPPDSNRGANPTLPPYLTSENVVSWYAAIDYVTLTAKVGSVRWGELVQQFVAAEESASYGNLRVPFGTHGYVGEMVGSFAYAFNEATGGVLVRASGSLAHQVFLAFSPYADNCSRADLQVTVKFAKDDRRLAARQFFKLFNRGAAGEKATENGRAVNFRMLADQNGASTLNLGSRTSRAYGRLYDKGRDPNNSPEESSHYNRCWRFELELKDDYSKGIWLQFLENRAQGVLDIAPQEIVETVFAWFRSKLVDVPDLGLDAEKYDLIADRRISTVETKLRWLVQQVSPTVNKLIDSGHRIETFVALGLASCDLLDQRVLVRRLVDGTWKVHLVSGEVV